MTASRKRKPGEGTFEKNAQGALENVEQRHRGVKPGSLAAELMGQHAEQVAEQVAQIVEPVAVVPPVTPEPASAADSFAFLDSPAMPANFRNSPRQVRGVSATPASQMNIRVSNEARFQVESYLMELKRAGRPVYMYEVIDVLLRNLEDPDFRSQVTALLDGREA